MKSGLVFCCTALILIFGMSAFADSVTTIDSQNAGGTFVGGGTLANIYVDHSELVFTDEDGNQAERVATIVNVFFTGPYDNFFGCYVIPDEDFDIDPGLQRAALRTTVSGPSNCGRVQRADGQPLQLAPGVVGVSADLQIDVQWFYYGAVGEYKGTFSDTCELFSTQSHNQTKYAYSAGIGKVASSTRFATAPRLAASYARINSTHSESSTSGTRSLACGGGGFVLSTPANR